MCADKGKKVVIIDFGWAVKRGPKGDDQIYPNHPLQNIFKYQKNITWRNLKIVQNFNFELYFNIFSPNYMQSPIWNVTKAKQIKYKNALQKATKDFTLLLDQEKKINR
jgi:hypothetical protein